MTTATAMKSGAGERSVRDPQEWTDPELLAACVQKDNRAWKELMRRYDDGVRAAVYQRLKPFVESLPCDFREDIMGAFYLKLLENDMGALRSFDFNKGRALFKWLAFIAVQEATDYLQAELHHGQSYAPIKDAAGVADEGGVLASGRKKIRGSLSARVRRDNAQALRAEEKRASEDRIRRRREISMHLA